MKTIKLVVLSCFIIFAQNVFSVIHTITQSDVTFNPSTLTVNVGDTVRWVWTGGTHTTTSKTIPAGAQVWDSPLTSTNSSFSYKVTVAGSYSYKCTPHESLGMVGTFNAVGTASSESLNFNNFNLFPNPFQDRINVTGDLEKIKSIEIFDLTGKLLLNNNVVRSETSINIDLSHLQSGIYFAILNRDGKKLTYKMIKK